MRAIGYYVHHHGDGHRQRALAIARHHSNHFILLGTGLADRTGDINAIDLPDDRQDGEEFDGHDREQDRPHALHYAPIGHDGIRARMVGIAHWIAVAKPALIVVDVSVEVAMLARLFATFVAYVRLSGRRDDTAHLEAYRAASILIAPFAEALDERTTPDWIRRKTIYAPGIVPRRVAATPQLGLVLMVCGRGGTSVLRTNLIDAARCTPDMRWRVIGLSSEASDLPSNLVFAGWTDDPEGEIARAEIVVGGAGDGLVGAVLASRRAFVCIPEQRAFEEQVHKAAALKRNCAAIVCERWPAQSEWPGILAAARGLDPDRQTRIDDPQGASRLAQILIDLADAQK